MKVVWSAVRDFSGRTIIGSVALSGTFACLEHHALSLPYTESGNQTFFLLNAYGGIHHGESSPYFFYLDASLCAEGRYLFFMSLFL